MESKADVNKTNNNGETPLHVSALSGSYESCAMLLDAGAKINKKTNEGLTPLHSSILAPNNSSRLASLLIDCGVGINEEDNMERTPLAMSTMHGNLAIVNLLIEKKTAITNNRYSKSVPLASRYM